MTTWTVDGLDRIGAADELQIASARRDGTLRRYETMCTLLRKDLP